VTTTRKGSKKEVQVQKILEAVGYKVARAPKMVRPITPRGAKKPIWISVKQDFFGVLDLIALRRDTPPLLIQAGHLGEMARKKADLDGSLVPWVRTGLFPTARLLLFLWSTATPGRNRSVRYGFGWHVYHHDGVSGWQRAGFVSSDGTLSSDSERWLGRVLSTMKSERGR
jgi:hypothetical protein